MVKAECELPVGRSIPYSVCGRQAGRRRWRGGAAVSAASRGASAAIPAGCAHSRDPVQDLHRAKPGRTSRVHSGAHSAASLRLLAVRWPGDRERRRRQRCKDRRQSGRCRPSVRAALVHAAAACEVHRRRKLAQSQLSRVKQKEESVQGVKNTVSLFGRHCLAQWVPPAYS